ncbi:hypothetical protein RclHR1_13980003 [Rhizophagus clarus]|uniref:MULE transposase domain-containing protein n=1 Tax=Rhizophagus clarus TaxID=94130 RepID=A0A2Z6QD81_9GLOM|nr:hypothetical protein RclHR1_13980003 [Rhizophagus clarus]
MKRFDCHGEINIIVDLEMKTASVNVVHEMLHELPKEVSVPKCVKDFINENINLLPKEIYARLVENGMDPEIRQNQIYFWWTKFGETRYKRDSDAFLSAKALLEKYNCIKILDINLPVYAIAFETGLHQMLIENNILIKEFGIDATYNTNNLGFELYVIHAEVNGAGFPLAYLFLEHNGKCGDGIRTEIITKFVLQLKEKGLDPEFILTDKDWAQIKACHSTWPNAKIQLCRWHINRAITMRLQSDQIVTRDTYNGYTAHKIFSFIDLKFCQPLMVPRNTKFCPKELRKSCWNLMDIHLHQHVLIPDNNEMQVSNKKIWTNAVYEMYSFCFQHNLPWLWSYMWREWYSDSHWFLWMRAGYDSKISILKTTMFVEAHWKVLKRDFLYKFF